MSSINTAKKTISKEEWEQRLNKVKVNKQYVIYVDISMNI